MSDQVQAMTAADEAKLQPKPLSQNGFVAFWQKIWRWWQGVWYGFSEKHPKLSGLIYMVFFFLVFSYGVTIWQFLVMTFLPYALTGLGTESWGWPNIVFDFANENGATYMIFGDANGLGYFLAFEIAVFTAQCINLPLQRNITYRSHGNPWIQAMWYFIGWVLVSIATNAIWGFINVFFTSWGWYLPGSEGLATVAGLIKTVLTGGVSMVVFFFVFLIIFPDVHKMEATRKKQLEEAQASGDAQKIAKAQEQYDIALEHMRRFDSEKNYATVNSIAEAKINGYNGMKKKLEKAKAAGKDAEEIKALEESCAKMREEALKAVNTRDEVAPKEKAIIDEVKASQAARKAAKKAA